MTSSPEGFVLLTPVRNESQMLVGLFQSVLSQTLRPSLWVLAENGSDDDSLAKAESLAEPHPWIVVSTRPKIDDYPWLKYASAIRFGFETAQREIIARGLNPKMIGVLDSDTVVDNDYFERLMTLAGRERTGIASGLIATEGGGRLENRPMPRACARLYGVDFLNDVGGFPLDAAYDTVLEIKTRNRGRDILVDPGAKGLHRRKSTSITGGEGLRALGIVRYVMGMDMISALAWFSIYAKALGIRTAVGFVAGYVEATRLGYPRTKDSEVIRHFRHSWIRFLSTQETRGAIHSIFNSK